MDETKQVEATAGPYAGQRLTMPVDEAEQAITDGWARDPFAPPTDEPPKEQTDEERADVVKKAEKAARKLRGEPDEGDDEGKGGRGETRDMSAGQAGEYDTRGAPPPRRPPPPPPPPKRR